MLILDSLGSFLSFYCQLALYALFYLFYMHLLMKLKSFTTAVFCCVGALAITGCLHHVDKDLLGWWLCERQVKSGGLNGRPEKLPDVRCLFPLHFLSLFQKNTKYIKSIINICFSKLNDMSLSYAFRSATLGGCFLA